MRKIEFIPGILAMRGNLSGNQKVGYPLQGGAAYDAPQGINHATAYRASYIGAKRAKDGLTYFSVKTKQTVNITPAARLKWAVLAACSLIYSEALNQSTSFKAAMSRFYGAFKGANPTSPRSRSMRAYFYQGIQQMVMSGDADYTFTETINGRQEELTLYNCFNLGNTEVPGTAVLPVDQFIKFGQEVWAFDDERIGGAKFTIDGIVKGSPLEVSGAAATWSGVFSADTPVFENPNWANVREGIAVHNTQNACVTYQNHVVYLNDTKVLPTDELVAGAKYVTKEAYSE